MCINILLPYKEKFTKNKASSVSITVSNNLEFSKFKKNIRIFGQNVYDPMYPKNFYGVKNSWNIFRSKNKNISYKMCEIINSEENKNQIIEIHNRPYLVNVIKSKLFHRHILTLFLHNDPLQMKGSRTIEERNFLISQLDKIYCVSDFIKRRFLTGIFDYDKKVIVLYNGVKRNEKMFPKKEKQVIFVGRIVSDKGVHLFLDAIKDIYKIFDDWNFKIIGSPKLGINKFDNFAVKIKEDFQNLGNRAQMLGYINPNDLNKIMTKSSIIVIPSLWQEPFGLVAAEAMSKGIAIIASNVGGLPEIIGNNGILINKINSKKISKKLKALIRDEELLNKYQKCSWENFDLNSKTISSLLDNYRRDLFSQK